MKPTRLCISAAALLLVAACQEQRQPTSPPLSADFSDALHGNNRNPHFYLLPPLVSAPDLTKEHFESGLQASVRVTEQPDGQPKFTGCTNNEPIAYLAATEFTSLQAYAVVWRPNNYATVAPPCIYRLQVEVFGTASSPGVVLGFADVQVLSRSTIKYLQTGQYIPLPKDLSLPFWFFIGQGAVFFAQTNGTDACPVGLDCAEAVVNPSQANIIVTTNKGAGILIPQGAFAGEVTLVIEEQTDRPCIPPVNLALPEFNDNRTGCYRYQRSPSDVSLSKPLIIAMCVDIGLLTHDQADRLQIFRFDPTEEAGGTAEALPNASAAFLPCEATRFGFVPRALDNLASLFAPRPLHAAAVHLGVGGSCRVACLSAPIFTWGMPGTLGKNSTDPQGQESPVTAPPSVRLTNDGDELHSPMLISGATATFEVAPGNGAIQVAPGTFGSRVDLVTVDGIATVQAWQLDPLTPKTNFLTASVPGASLSQVTFTAGLIKQNRPDIGCSLLPGGESHGYGYRIEFDWADIPGATGYELEARHGTAPPIVSQIVEGSQFTFTACNTFVIDMNLDGWQWRVRTTAEGAAWSAPVSFAFLPCRLADGTPCNAPSPLQ